MPEQTDFFDDHSLPESLDPPVQFKSLRHPIWTENKARLIERYLYYFVLITKHGTYIDGFAGPQQPDNPDMWAAKLVLESEPRWLRHFFLCDKDPSKVALLSRLNDDQPSRRRNEPKRTVEIQVGDFNDIVTNVLCHEETKRDATFCLLDQRTFECHWSTVEALANHKPDGYKIELFYFLPDGWIGRALAAQKNIEVLQRWWGRNDWDVLRNLNPQSRADVFCRRMKDEFGYRSVVPWPIFERASGGRVMYFMIHATDHAEAPKLMRRAYDRALGPKENMEQMKLELDELL